MEVEAQVRLTRWGARARRRSRRPRAVASTKATTKHARFGSVGRSRRSSIRRSSRTASRFASPTRCSRAWSASSRGRPSSCPSSRRAGRRATDGQHVDVHAAPRREVPRRHAVQRGGGLRQLQPLVQLPRPVPAATRRRTTGRRSSAASRSRAQALPAREEPVQELPGRRRHDRRRSRCGAVGVVPRRSSLPAFSIAEPDGAEAVRRRQGHRRRTACSGRQGRTRREHPIGTGPFKFESWKIGDKLELVAQRRLLGPQGQAGAGHLPADPGQRRAPAGAADRRDPRLRPRRAAGHADDPEEREPEDARRGRRSTSATSTINQRSKPLDNLARAAGGRARARPRRRSSTRSTAAAARSRNAVPAAGALRLREDGVPKYQYNPEKSKQLLQQAGLTLPVKIEFWYPTDVSRPYMPDPKRNFRGVRARASRSRASR